VSTCHISTKSNALLNLLSQLPTALPAHLNAHPAVLKNRQEWSVDTSTYHPGPTLKARVMYVNSRSMQPQQEPMNQLLSWRCTFHVHRNTDCIQWQFAPTATSCSCRHPAHHHAGMPCPASPMSCSKSALLCIKFMHCRSRQAASCIHSGLTFLCAQVMTAWQSNVYSCRTIRAHMAHMA